MGKLRLWAAVFCLQMLQEEQSHWCASHTPAQLLAWSRSWDSIGGTARVTHWVEGRSGTDVNAGSPVLQYAREKGWGPWPHSSSVPHLEPDLVEKTGFLIPGSSPMDGQATNAIFFYHSSPLIAFVTQGDTTTIYLYLLFIFILSSAFSSFFKKNNKMFQVCKTAQRTVEWT